jgi:glyoxylase-like metal-dependent hydrolase (beta-lactamase superfamily II)
MNGENRRFRVGSPGPGHADDNHGGGAVADGNAGATAAGQWQACSEHPGPIKRSIISSIGPDTYLINEFGADSIYLVVGTRRALVIDTGSGFMDLKATVEGLTKLPYDVAIAHSHLDHAGGAGVAPSSPAGSAPDDLAVERRRLLRPDQVEAAAPRVDDRELDRGIAGGRRQQQSQA